MWELIYLMVLTAEGGQALHPSPLVLVVLLGVKLVWPEHLEAEPCPKQWIPKGILSLQLPPLQPSRV